MTNQERFRRKMAPDPCYQFCLGEPEDLNHVFRCCRRVRDLWSYMVDNRKRHQWNRYLFQAWVMENIKVDN